MFLSRFRLTALLLLGSALGFAIACGGGEKVVEKVVVQTVVVEKQVEKKVVETVVVEKQVPGAKVVETVIVEKQVPGAKVVETVVVEKPVEKKVVETVVVEKERVVEKPVVQTVIVEKEKIVIATPTPGGEATKPAPSGKAPSGTLTIASSSVGNPNGDPQKCIPGCGNEKFRMGGYETLLFTDDLANVIPRLAASWVVSDDLAYVDFKIQKGVQFQGDWGTMTAQDVAWSFNRANPRTNPDSVHDQAGDFSALMKRMDAIDDETVRMTVNKLEIGGLRRALSPFWQSMGIHSKKVFDTLGSDGMQTTFIGTGPFQFDTWVKDDKAVLTAVQNHWRKTPEMAKVRILAVPEPTVRATMLETGEADVALIDIKDIPPLKKKGFGAINTASRINAVYFGGNYWESTVFGTNDPVDRPGYDTSLPWVGEFGNADSMEQARKVRQAMALTIDREGINNSILDGLGVPAYTPMVSINNPDFRDEWKIPFDPNKARDLMAEAGFAKGFDVVLWGGGDPGSGTGREVAEAIAAGWQNELGVNVTLDATVYSTHRPKLVQLKWNQIQYRTCADAFAALPLDLPKSNNSVTQRLGGTICGGFLIPKWAELFDAATQEPDKAKRKELGAQVVQYGQDWFLQPGVVEIPQFNTFNAAKIKKWPIPAQVCIGGCIWFNLEEIVWEP